MRALGLFLFILELFLFLGSLVCLFGLLARYAPDCRHAEAEGPIAAIPRHIPCLAITRLGLVQTEVNSCSPPQGEVFHYLHLKPRQYFPIDTGRAYIADGEALTLSPIVGVDRHILQVIAAVGKAYTKS